jgi:hypothetical protein
MCSTVPKVIGASAAPVASTPGGAGTRLRAGRLISSWAKPSRWKPCTPADVFAQIVAPLRQGPHRPQVCAPKIETNWPGQAADAGADRVDAAGGFGADDQRHLALGERHAAPAPDVDVVERDLGDAHRHLTNAGRRRRRQIHFNELAVFHELQGAHGVSFRRFGRIRPVHRLL